MIRSNPKYAESWCTRWDKVLRGVFGRHSSCRLAVYLPRWLGGWLVLQHERGHAWGIVSCSDRSCLMHEGARDGWREKWDSWPHQLWRLARGKGMLCNACRAHLGSAGALER